MEYSFLAARLSFTFDMHIYIFSWQVNSAAAAAARPIESEIRCPINVCTPSIWLYAAFYLNRKYVILSKNLRNCQVFFLEND